MAWITLSPDDIPIRADEREQVDAAVGRGDTLPDIIASTIRTIRGRAAVRNPIGPDGTIPDELEEAAKAIVAFRYLTESGADELVTTARTNAEASAQKDLRAVASGDLKIVPPNDYAPVQPQSPSPKINRRRLHYQPRNFDGV